jgi:Fur family ferric uptake transcriptional regulator
MDSVTLKTILGKNQIKTTKVRLIVLNVLINSDSALSHHEISEALSNEEIDKVTLYRTLKLFESKKLVHKVATKDRNWQYAICLHNNNVITINRSHAHFICDACDKIFCMPETKTELTISNISYLDNFMITGKELRLHGLCPECQNT